MTQDEGRAGDFLFGYGSIINNASREATTKAAGASTDGAVIAELHGGRGVRSWSFRCHTGFTALGLTITREQAVPLPTPAEDDHPPVIGVLFPVTAVSLSQFDIREVGYSRIEISVHSLRIRKEFGDPAIATQTELALTKGNARVWTYVPEEDRQLAPDHNFPILQSYVDICVRGCLEWGGPPLVRAFLLGVQGWSEFFLDDTPSSRRPWIHRKDYQSIDEALREVSDHVRLCERRHPEEYSARHMHNMTGIWGVASRDARYTGRTSELSALTSKVLANASGVVEVVGMGGVGKTALVSEFCHLHSMSVFSLIVWLRAESGSSVASDMRRFGSEFGILSRQSEDEDKDEDDATVVAEVLRRLMRCRSKYLLVFDNVDDHEEVLRCFLPRGQQASLEGSCTTSLRHVIFTSRASSRLAADTLQLTCFDQRESVCFLRSSIGPAMDGSNSESQLCALSTALGHLPLALSMAAAYISSCDISAAEYLGRLTASSLKSIEDMQAVAASLNLTLRRIEVESPQAGRALCMVSYLDADSISKRLIELLLLAHNRSALLRANEVRLPSYNSFVLYSQKLIEAVLVVIVIVSEWIIVRALAMCALLVMHQTSRILPIAYETKALLVVDESKDSITVAVDKVWEVLKKYSLLSSFGGSGAAYGSIHRLQAAAIREDIRYDVMLQTISCVISSLEQFWTYDSKDSSTWLQAGEATRHIEAVVVHVSNVLSERVGMNALSSEFADQTLVLCELVTHAASYLAFVLSRFQSASSLLRSSFEILKQIEQWTGRDISLYTANNMYHLGRLSRYCGKFAYSEECLRSALEIYETRHSYLQVSDALHELGVLALRNHKTEESREFLTSSLEKKRSLNVCDSSIAATLHQLAVVDTGDGDYDSAEKLLKECLVIESEPTASRGATLQQLGRVALRRGLLSEAMDYLKESLKIYKDVYGDSSRHLNIAVVYHQLGIAAKLSHNLCDARECFQKSLSIKQSICNDRDSIEVVVEMQSLGEVELAMGSADSAEALFARCRAVATNLLESTRESWGEGEISHLETQRNTFSNALLLSIYSLRAVAKIKGQANVVAELSKEAKRLKRMHLLDGHAEQDQKAAVVDLESDHHFVSKLLSHRQSVRSMASQLAKNDLDQSHCVEHLTHICSDLDSFLRDNREHSRLTEVAGGFVESISFAKKSEHLPRALFEACDAFREELRSLCISVEDKEVRL